MSTSRLKCVSPPPVFQLALRGERFDLGESLSARGTNLVLALDFVRRLLTRQSQGMGAAFTAFDGSKGRMRVKSELAIAQMLMA